MLTCFNLVWLFATLWAIARQAPLSMRVSRQEYWSGLLFPSLGDLPDSGIEPKSPMSPALAGWPFTTSTYIWQKYLYICLYIRVYIYKTKSVRRQQAILIFKKMNRRLEQTFRQTVVIEDMKSFLALIIIREAQIKTTDYNFAPMKRAKIKKTNNKCWWK